MAIGVVENQMAPAIIRIRVSDRREVMFGLFSKFYKEGIFCIIVVKAF